jgi:hypothetical protein
MFDEKLLNCVHRGNFDHFKSKTGIQNRTISIIEPDGYFLNQNLEELIHVVLSKIQISE